MKKNNLNQKISSINQFFNSLTPEEGNNFMGRMDDIFSSHGLTKEIFHDIIKEGRVPFSYPENRLHCLEGATDLVLFRIKYSEQKLENFSAKDLN